MGIETMKQEIIDALGYKTPAESFGLCVGGMQTAALCRLYGVTYGAKSGPSLRDLIRDGSEAQTLEAHEIVGNVIEYGVRKHPEYVNGPTWHELQAENAMLREGMKGDYDLDARLDWAKEKAELQAENRRLAARVEELEGLLVQARCPDCDGSGVIEIPFKIGVDEQLFPVYDVEHDLCNWCAIKERLALNGEALTRAGEGQ